MIQTYKSYCILIFCGEVLLCNSYTEPIYLNAVTTHAHKNEGEFISKFTFQHPKTYPNLKVYSKPGVL